MEEEEHVVKKNYAEDSFQHIFWKQPKQASTKTGPGMHWRPLMNRWSIYLRHQSSKVHEILRDSGCIHLPSQRTLRDYTNCVKASSGFSAVVDKQLYEAASLGSCKE